MENKFGLNQKKILILCIAGLMTNISIADQNALKYISIKNTNMDNSNVANASGDNSISVGVGAASGGISSISVGYLAGQNVAGHKNVAIGEKSMVDESKGSVVRQQTGSVAIGTGTLKNFSGNYNVALGNLALSNTDLNNRAAGSYTVALGYEAGKDIKSSTNQSIYVGRSAGESSKGSENVYIGKSAGTLTEGSYNTVLGIATGHHSKGANNVSIGYSSGNFVVGDNNIAIGTFSGRELPNNTLEINEAIAIGNNSKATVDSAIALGSSSKANRESGHYGYNLGKNNASKESIPVYEENKVKIDELENNISTLKGEISTLKERIKTSNDDTEKSTLKRELNFKKAELVEKERDLSPIVSAWRASLSALSVGDEENSLTRQITNVAAGTNDTDVVNVAQLKNISLNIVANNDSKSSVKLSDSLSILGSDGEIVTKVENSTVSVGLSDEVKNKISALNDGLSGTLVYTNANGEKLSRGKDGNYYLASDLTKMVKNSDIVSSVVNVDGSTNSTQVLSNIKSVLSGEDSREFIDNVNKSKGKTLNNAATVDDIKGVVKAGISVKGNSGDTIKTELGKELNIVGNGAVKVVGRNGKIEINIESLDAGNKTITKVADGKEEDDAINLGQLSKGLEKVNAGVSQAMAMSSLPQINSNGEYRLTLAGAYATYKGEHSLALGLSGSNKKRDVLYKLNGSLSTKGNLGLGLGLAYQFFKDEKEDNKELLEKISDLELKNQELSNKYESLSEQNKIIKDILNILLSESKNLEK